MSKKLAAAEEAVVEEEINSTMADLEAAWEEVESRDAEETPEAEAEEVEEVEGEEEKPEEEPKQQELPLAAETDQPTPAAVEEKAPAGWKPEAREHWAKLPPEIRKEVLRRERDFSIGIQYTREAAKKGEAFEQLVHPFRPMFSANGQNDFDGVRGVLQVAATLQMGSTQQKVKAVADLINNYGVDLMALDGYLADGQIPTESRAADDIERKLQERLAPYEQFMQQFQQQRQLQTQRVANEANQTIQQFAADPKNEFYRDVRLDMADLLDMAAQRGVSLSLQDAYQRACMMNPEIAKVITLRQSSQNLSKKKKASSSISGAPISSATKVPQDLRSEIEAAWDNLEKR